MPPYQGSPSPLTPLSRIESDGTLQKGNCGGEPFSDSSRGQSLFHSLPNIQMWIKQRLQRGGEAPIQSVLRLIRDDSMWLGAVVGELKQIVPAGAVSRSIWELFLSLLCVLAEYLVSQTDKLAPDILARMLMEEDCTGNIVPSIAYSQAIRAAPESAEEIFRTMVTRYRKDHRRCQPSVIHRAALIQALSKIGKAKQACSLLWKEAPINLFNDVLRALESPADADKLLSSMEMHLVNRSSVGTRPNLRSFYIVLRKWVGYDDERVQGILERTLVWSKTFPELSPTIHFFVEVMHTYSESIEKLDLLVLRLEKYVKCMPEDLRGLAEYQLSRAPYEVQMQAWAKLGKPDRLEWILTKMVRLGIPPSLVCWRLALKTWISAGHVDQAERILCRSIGRSADVDLCNLVLLGWSQRDPLRAESYFDWMCLQGPHTQPNEDSYEIVLSAWSNSKDQAAGNHVKHLLQRMEKSIKIGGLHPTARTYEHAVAALGKATNKIQVLKLLRRAELFVKKKDSTKLLSTKDGIVTLASRSGLGLAQEIFKMMEQARVIPTSVSFNCVVAAMAKYGGSESPVKTRSFLKSKEQAPPDVESCNMVLAICLSNTLPQAPGIAKSMIQHMIQEYCRGNKSMLPIPSFFTRLFKNLHVQRKKIPAVATLAMVDVPFPDVEFANACVVYAMTVCAWSHDKEAPSCVLRLWQKIEETPSRYLDLILMTFCNHARHPAATIAESLVSQVNDPSEETLSLLLEVIAKRGNSAQEAYSLMQRYISRLAKPRDLSHVLLACAKTSITDQRYNHLILARHAMAKWKELGRKVRTVDYVWLVTCGLRLPDQVLRKVMVQRILDECCADGLLTQGMEKRCRHVIA